MFYFIYVSAVWVKVPAVCACASAVVIAWGIADLEMGRVVRARGGGDEAWARRCMARGRCDRALAGARAAWGTLG